MHEKQAYYANITEKGNGFELQLCLDFFNRRLRVDDYRGNPASISRRLAQIAGENGFTKIFMKTREEDWQALLSMGYMLEGVYKGYFDGRDAYCMVSYTDAGRRTSDYWIEEDRILEQVHALPWKTERAEPEQGFVLRPATAQDAGRLAVLYAQTFQTYPTPMMRPSYIGKVMEEGTVFCIVEHDGLLVSAASAEINARYRNAEITDCATLPDYRGKGLMRLLIRSLEDDLERRKIHCAYSLSRALSFGMNASLHQLGYRYFGRLTKNCEIYDKLEDMNLWVKILPSS